MANKRNANTSFICWLQDGMAVTSLAAHTDHAWMMG